MSEIVDTAAEAEAEAMAPLLVRRPLEAFLDAQGLGSGPIRASRIGDGQSNVTYLIERDGLRAVLRRPPRPPLPPSSHDMLREARVQRALGTTGARVPRVRLVCDDESILGVPFYLMDLLDGVVLADRLPEALSPPEERRRIGHELVDALAEIHAVDWEAAGLTGFGRPTGYLERQVRRFAGLWEINATRDLPEVARVAEWLRDNVPESGPATLVHGDYRLGNVIFGRGAPARLAAVLDWELSTIGDPLADLGYLLATYNEAGAPPNPLALSPVTGLPGFPGRQELAARYQERTGRALGGLPWYEALALWKGAIFCEAIYGRWLRGERPADDAFPSSLAEGVPRLVQLAGERAARL